MRSTTSARHGEERFGAAESDEVVDLIARPVRLRPALARVLSIAPPLPGDVIARSSTEGRGAQRQPQRWLRLGHRVEVDVQKVGLLSSQGGR